MNLDHFLWLVLLFMTTTLAMRWVLSITLAPLNHHVIRRMLVHRIMVLCADVTVKHEAEGSLLLTIGTHTCTLELGQLYRRCAEQPGAAGQLILHAAQAISDALAADEALPADWTDQVVPLLRPARSTPPPGCVPGPTLGLLQAGYALPEAHAFRWITEADLQTAGLTVEALHAIAVRNLERSCNMLVMDTSGEMDDGVEAFLRFQTQDGLDAARLLIPSFYQRFAPRFGDRDPLVAVPTRDSLIMVGSDDPAAAQWLSAAAAGEYRRHAYPLQTDLLMVLPHGVIPWHSGRRRGRAPGDVPAHEW